MLPVSLEVGWSYSLDQFFSSTGFSIEGLNFFETCLNPRSLFSVRELESEHGTMLVNPEESNHQHLGSPLSVSLVLSQVYPSMIMNQLGSTRFPLVDTKPREEM